MNWWKGLLAAALGGAAGTVSQVVAGSGTVNKTTGAAAGGGSLGRRSGLLQTIASGTEIGLASRFKGAYSLKSSGAILRGSA